MANTFDTISDNPTSTGISNINLVNETFHVFSKSPASPATALGDASNRSGHTIVSSDVWAEEIPAFFFAKTTAAANAILANAQENDLCRIGDTIAICKNKQWVVTWNSYADIEDGHLFTNAAGDGVIRFHKNRVAHFLNLDNNANDNGQGLTAKIQGWDKDANDGNGGPYEYIETAPQFVTQFVSPTDKIVKGIPSKGFGPIVMKGVNGTALTESIDSDAGYISNSYAGIIQFNKTGNSGIYVHAFEYVGKKLDASIGDIKSDIAELDDKLSKISVTASGGVQDASTNAKAAGLSVTTEKRTDEDGKEETIPVIDITTGTIGSDNATSNARLVTGTAVKSYIDNALGTNGAITDAISDAITEATLSGEGEDVIANATDGSKLVTATQVTEYVEKHAQVTVTVGAGESKTEVTSTNFEFAGSENDDIAVTAEMDASGKVTYSAALTKATLDGDGKADDDNLVVSAGDAKTIANVAIEEALEATSEGSLGATIAAVKTTADGAVQSVKKDDSSSSLLTVTDGTNVVISLSSDVADKTYVNTAVNGLKDTAIASQTGGGSGISITLGGKVGAPTLSGTVNTASYTPATETEPGKWTDSTLSNVVTGTDVKNALADVATAHTKDIQTVTSAIEAITTSGFERIVVTELPSTDIKLNAIYLMANKESDINEYIEYIYVGGSIVEGQVTGGSFEQIGTTKTDLTEYAKTTYVDAAVKTAKDAADAAQATIDEFIAETYAADKSALEDSISGVSQVVASNHGEFTEFVNTTYAADKKATEDSIATKIATVSVTTDATHFGAEHIKSATDTSKNVTITVTRNAEWSIGSTKPANTITSVINGKMSNGNTVDDANLVNGTSMYAGNTSLTTYVGTLGKLTDGTNMFSGCTGLSTFVADLTSLTTGNGMFANCKLTEESLIYIVDTLPTVTSGTITVGVADGVDKSKYVTEAATKGWTLA